MPRDEARAVGAWKAYTEDRGGSVYYYNAQTKVSTNDEPPGFNPSRRSVRWCNQQLQGGAKKKGGGGGPFCVRYWSCRLLSIRPAVSLQPRRLE